MAAVASAKAGLSRPRTSFGWEANLLPKISAGLRLLIDNHWEHATPDLDAGNLVLPMRSAVTR